jgi:tetratricopeptide (TPR) repeat protein
MVRGACPKCGKKQVEEEVNSIKEAEVHFKKGIAILDEKVALFPGFAQSSTAALSAAEEFKRAAELVPSSSDYRYFYAVALRWGLQFKSAEEEIKKVLEIDPNHFEAKKTVEYGPKWKDAFNYPSWSESSTSVPDRLKPLVPDLRPGSAATRVVIVRDGARKIVSFLNKSSRSLWCRPLSMNIKMKIEFVHSKTPYGSIIASYLVVGDDPMHPLVNEILLNPNKPGHEFGDACMLGENLSRMLLQQDYTYLIFVDENNAVVLNKKLVFDSAMQSNLRKLENALNEVERLGETMEPARFQQAVRWHGNNFPLSNIKL